MANLGMITLDTTDEQSAAAWWRLVLKGEYIGQYPGFTMISIPGCSARLGFQQVEKPTEGKNRVHLDLEATGNRAEEVEQLIAAGATLIEEHNEDPDFGWTVLRDPFGIVFCLSDPHDE